MLCDEVSPTVPSSSLFGVWLGVTISKGAECDSGGEEREDNTAGDGFSKCRRECGTPSLTSTSVMGLYLSTFWTSGFRKLGGCDDIVSGLL